MKILRRPLEPEAIRLKSENRRKKRKNHRIEKEKKEDISIEIKNSNQRKHYPGSYYLFLHLSFFVNFHVRILPSFTMAAAAADSEKCEVEAEW